MQTFLYNDLPGSYWQLDGEKENNCWFYFNDPDNGAVKKFFIFNWNLQAPDEIQLYNMIENFISRYFVTVVDIFATCYGLGIEFECMDNFLRENFGTLNPDKLRKVKRQKFVEFIAEELNSQLDNDYV